MLQGRFHLYEGFDPGLVIEPVLLFGRLGAAVVVLTNAAGGLDPSFGPGTLMVMSDHINLTGRNPLDRARTRTRSGPRFADLTDAWSPRLRARLRAAAAAESVEVAEGVYVGLTGPTYETPAEVRMLAALGGHAVGMSTVLECIAARWAGLEVCGVSLVTNAGAGYTGEPLTHEEVLAAGADAGPRLARVIAPVRGGSGRGLGRLLGGSDRTVAPQVTGSSRPAAFAAAAFSAQAARTWSLCGPDRAVAVAVVELVAVAERHALGREERAEERRHREDLVADELEQPPDLPLGHRAQAQAGHVDERPQVRRHDQVGPGRVGEHEAGVLARDAGRRAARRTARARRRPAPRTARAGPDRPRRSSGGASSPRP